MKNIPKCKDCGCELSERKLAPRGSGRFRTVCRDCWNKKQISVRKKHRAVMSIYTKCYNKKRRTTDVEFKTATNKQNLKSNLKAIKELKNSYIKHRLKNTNNFDAAIPPEVIELKRLSIKIHRATHDKN